MDSQLGYILNKDIIDAKTGKAPVINNLQQFLVWKFLKDPSNTVWPREIKVALRLLRFCRNVNFWNFLDLGFKLNSLCWFISQNGKALLIQQKSKWEFQETREAERQPEKAKVLSEFIK